MKSIRFTLKDQELIPVMVESNFGGDGAIHFSIDGIFVMFLSVDVGRLIRIKVNEPDCQKLKKYGFEFDLENKIKTDQEY